MRPLALGLARRPRPGPGLPRRPAGQAAAEPEHEHDHRRVRPRPRLPALQVKRVVTGLDHPWDVRPLGDGRLLFTQRDRATVSVCGDGRKRTVDFPSGEVWVSGETGLMGLEVDPDFADNGRFYTCQGGDTSGGGHDVRVIAWRLDDAGHQGHEGQAAGRRVPDVQRAPRRLPAARRAGRLAAGRHRRRRDRHQPRGPHLARRQDAAAGPHDRCTVARQPVRRLQQPDQALRPDLRPPQRAGPGQRADGTLWSVEQGTYRDDEVNLLVDGGDYGYNPVPGYNEEVPMTDQSLPGNQQAARGAPATRPSRRPAVASSTAARLGAYDGTLAVAALKAERVLFLTLLGSSGTLERTVPERCHVRRIAPTSSRTAMPDRRQTVRGSTCPTGAATATTG